MSLTRSRDLVMANKVKGNLSSILKDPTFAGGSERSKIALCQIYFLRYNTRTQWRSQPLMLVSWCGGLSWIARGSVCTMLTLLHMATFGQKSLLHFGHRVKRARVFWRYFSEMASTG